MADVPYVTNIFNITQGVSQPTVDALNSKLDQLIAQGATIVTDLSVLDAAVTQMEANVATRDDVEGSASTLLNELAQIIRDNANDPAALAALADRITAADEAAATSNAALAAAVAANTPAAPTEPPAEPTP